MSTFTYKIGVIPNIHWEKVSHWLLEAMRRVEDESLRTKGECFVRNSLSVLGSVAGSTTKCYIHDWLQVTGCLYINKNVMLASVHTGKTGDLSLFFERKAVTGGGGVPTYSISTNLRLKDLSTYDKYGKRRIKSMFWTIHSTTYRANGPGPCTRHKIEWMGMRPMNDCDLGRPVHSP